MNFKLTHIPKREEKPRKQGVTMMMDKGLSIREVEDFIETSGHLTDLVKFGFGTSYVTTKLKEKIKLYQDAGIKTYFGGTLFDAFYVSMLSEKYKTGKMKPLKGFWYGLLSNIKAQSSKEVSSLIYIIKNM